MEQTRGSGVSRSMRGYQCRLVLVIVCTLLAAARTPTRVTQCIFYCILSRLGKTESEIMAEYPAMFIRHYHAVKALITARGWSDVPLASFPTWKGWQKAVFHCFSHQNDRSICFVVDLEGGQGKTVLSKIIQSKMDSFFCTGGKTNDLAHMYKSAHYKAAIFDLSRNPAEKDFHPYAFAEMLKNGQFSSGKYDGCMKRFPPPKVIWFANQMPDMDKLSGDRYCIHKISMRSDQNMYPVDSDPPPPPSMDID